MSPSVNAAADAVLNRVVSSSPGVPGVVAIVTDRSHNTYEGVAGKRKLGAPEPMTLDTVFAIFSTTKAITGTACLQLVEDGKLDLDQPAKKYVPEIGKAQVITGFDKSGAPMLRAPKRDITVRMLLLHTAGFGYDFFSRDATTGFRRTMASRVSSPQPGRRSRRRSCSIRASSGNTARTSTGQARSSRLWLANGSARS